MPDVLDVAKQAQADDQKKKDDDLWLLFLALLEDDEPQAVWAEYVPPTFAGLLTGDDFEWNGQSQVYKSDSGTTVNANAVQRIVLAAGHAAEIDAERGLAAAQGQTDALDKWGDDTVNKLMSLYIASAAAGVGGVDNLDEKNFTSAIRAAANLRDSIDNIVADLRSGKISLPMAVNRAGMNAQQVNGVFQAARRQSHMDAADENGVALFTQEQNVLTQTAQHCAECPELSARGWVKIGSLPLPGARECQSNCKCHLEFRP